MSASSTTEPAPEAHGSSVSLRGRVTTAPEQRQLPSGDALVAFRISVPRGPTPLGRGSRQSSDWVDCVAASPRVRRTASAWSVGDEVEVDGVLRRRFFRSDEGRGGSRLEVEALRARRVRRASSGQPSG